MSSNPPTACAGCQKRAAATELVSLFVDRNGRVTPRLPRWLLPLDESIVRSLLGETSQLIAAMRAQSHTAADEAAVTMLADLLGAVQDAPTASRPPGRATLVHPRISCLRGALRALRAKRGAIETALDPIATALAKLAFHAQLNAVTGLAIAGKLTAFHGQPLARGAIVLVASDSRARVVTVAKKTGRAIVHGLREDLGAIIGRPSAAALAAPASTLARNALTAARIVEAMGGVGRLRVQ